MNSIPWTADDRANAVILKAYFALRRGRALLLEHGGRWASAPAPRTPSTPIYKGGRQKAGGCAPHFLVKIKAGAKTWAWRWRVRAGRAALAVAQELAAVVGDGG